MFFTYVAEASISSCSLADCSISGSKLTISPMNSKSLKSPFGLLVGGST